LGGLKWRGLIGEKMSIQEGGLQRIRWTGVVLITLTGLLNFHIPHFLIESPRSPTTSSPLIEIVFLANLLGALLAAVGIARRRRWGWLLGFVVCLVSFLLYLAQETVGLPGLPKMWLEPSRIFSLIVEGLFVAVAWIWGLASTENRVSRRPIST
jgi:hypothetical protein